MISSNDWDRALDAWVEDERERLGGRPTASEIARFRRGELPKEDAARVRALLVYYPDLTPLLRAKSEKRWLGRLMSYAAVAAAAVCVTHLAIEPRLTRETSRPYVHESRYELRGLHSRGGAAETALLELPADEERYLVTIALSESPHDPAYRIELFDGSTPVWRSGSVQPVDGTFEVSLPRESLRGGTYRLVVFGVDDDGAHLRDEYRLRVAPAPQNSPGRIF